jgi:hypothetical protein
MQARTNYIYILFAIAYFVYTIIKAGKKSTAKRSTTVNQPEQSPSVKPPVASTPPVQGVDLKKMLEELMGGTPGQDTPEEPLPQKTRQRKPEPVPHHLEHQKNVSHTFDKAKSSVAYPNPVAEKPKAAPRKVVAEAVVEEEANMDFDVRQAIIFSEILKRPEY